MAASRPSHSINVTPLADVMLVLLIIFMVVTPLIPRGMDVRVPEANHPEEHPEDERTLVVAMTEDGALFLNEERTSEERLLPTLSSLMEARSKKLVFLKAGEVLDYGEVLRLMDLCRRAGVEDVVLVTRDRSS